MRAEGSRIPKAARDPQSLEAIAEGPTMALIDLACKSAEEFLETISPRRLRARARAEKPHLTLPEKWMFRGQGDADWRLVPSAFRPAARFRTHDGWMTVAKLLECETTKRPGLLMTAALQAQLHVFAEADTLADFLRVADYSGLPLPEDSQQLRKDLGLAGTTPTDDWPALSLRSALALAQHYGLPTRLLDWTLDHSVATYLAAKSGIKERSNALAVWVLDGGRLEMEVRWKEVCDPDTDARCKLRIVTAPAATNPNLRAQRGLFTLLEGPRGVGVAPEERLRHEMRPIDEAIEGMVDLDLVKVTVPTREARRLLDFLALEGVTAARLFPGYDGVVTSLRDEELIVEGPPSFAGIAARVGIPESSLSDLLRGKAPQEAAEKLGVQAAGLRQFLAGTTPAAMSTLLRLPPGDVATLTREAGNESLRWFLLGLLMR